MTRKFNINVFIVLILGLGLLLASCGKKAKIIDIDNQPEVIRPAISEIEKYMDTQTVSCEGNQSCPTYIAKIVVLDQGTYRFCTGFLIDDNKLVTSASCLPSQLRMEGLSCNLDVFVFFPKSSSRSVERVSCEKVLQSSSLDTHLNVSKDPVTWRDDVSILQLGSMQRRRHALFSRKGALEGKKFTTWMVDQLDEKTAIIKKSTCESVHNSYINPLVSNEFSPNMLFSDCPITNGGSGAPVLVGREVRSVISTKMSQELRDQLGKTGLLFEGLREIFHATNLACIPMLEDTDMSDDKECLKSLTEIKVDNFRSEMYSTSNLFKEIIGYFEESLDTLSPHLRFGVKLISESNGDIQRVVLYPKCFKPLSEWLSSYGNRGILVSEVMIPVVHFRKVMDSYGKIKGIKVEDTGKTYHLQYSLKNLRSSKKSSVLTWNAEEDLKTYQGITETCGPSLF